MLVDVVVSEFVLFLLAIGISGRSSSELISIIVGDCPTDGDCWGCSSSGNNSCDWGCHSSRDNSCDWGCHSSGDCFCDYCLTCGEYRFGISGYYCPSCCSANNLKRCVAEKNCKECWVFDGGDFWRVSSADVLKSWAKIILSYSSSACTVASTIKS